jgi:hypothetical protein
MGPFCNSEGCEYILVAIDYVSKWVEALPCRVADAMHSKKMFHEVIFLRYGVPRIVISDGGSHFIDWTFRKALLQVGVDNQIATPYHPQTSGQAKMLNKQIKNILQRTVNQMSRSWRSKLREALWAYQTSYKTPICLMPYQLLYGKTCHLLMELEHKSFWAIKKWNMDLKAAKTKRKIQIAELEEWREKAYHGANLYKERIKRWHDKRVKTKQFKPGEKALLFNSHVDLFGHGKLCSKWEGPYLVLCTKNHGAVTLQCDEGIHSRLMAKTLNYSLSQINRISRKWMSSIFLN